MQTSFAFCARLTLSLASNSIRTQMKTLTFISLMTTSVACLGSCTNPAASDAQQPWIVDRFDDIKGHPLRSTWIRTASARTERVDLLPGRSGQSADAISSSTRTARPTCRSGAPLETLYHNYKETARPTSESARKIPQKSVVRQRHPPPLFQRQVPPEFSESFFRARRPHR